MSASTNPWSSSWRPMSFADRPSSSRSRSYSGANSPMPANPAAAAAATRSSKSPKRGRLKCDQTRSGHCSSRAVVTGPETIICLQLAGMRFAFTAAQSNCTWSELAELWDVADGLDVFSTGWVYDHFYPLRTGPEEPTLEGWTCLAMLLARTRRLRGGVHGDRHPVPPSGRAGEHGGDGRHRLGRPPRVRPRCRLVRAGVRGLRDRVGLDRRALRPLRGGVDRHPVAADRSRRPHSTGATTSSATRGANRRRPAAASSDRARRQGRASLAAARGPLRRPLELLRRRSRRSSAGCGEARRALRRRGAQHRRPRRCRSTSGHRPTISRASPTRSPPTATPARR